MPARTIAAFDVAIKTLSFCILEYQTPEGEGGSGSKKYIPHEELPIKILDWQILNLIKPDRIACSGLTDGGNPCIEPARHFGVRHRHKDENGEWVATTKIYYCTKHKRRLEKKVRDKVKPIPEKTTKNTPIREIYIEMVTELDKYPELMRVDEVVIENQNARQTRGFGGGGRFQNVLNPKMIAVSSGIYSYFLIRGVVDGGRGDGLALRYVSAENNLSTSGHMDFSVVNKENKKAYDRKKAQSVEYARSILQGRGFDNWLEMLEGHNKQDDLADSLTHAYSVVIKEWCSYRDMKSGEMKKCLSLKST